MDKVNTDLENKCENMMNIVVESRKRFGKMCVDYEHKSSIMENKLLHLQIETFENFKFKPKHPIPVIDHNDSKDFDELSVELLERQRKLEVLRKAVKNTQEVVNQLKEDSIGRRLRDPLTAEVLLTNAQNKIS